MKAPTTTTSTDIMALAFQVNHKLEQLHDLKAQEIDLFDDTIALLCEWAKRLEEFSHETE